MRTIPLIRCLPKMSPSSSTSTGSQIATWRRSLTWTRREFSFDLQSLLTGKIFVWLPAFLSEPGSARYSSAPSITTVWFNYQTSYNDFFEVNITETVTLSPNIQTVNNPKQCHVTSSNPLFPIHKYVTFRHQLLDFSKINNWWSLAVIVLQRKASMQQNAFLLVPVIKGCMYINTL